MPYKLEDTTRLHSRLNVTRVKTVAVLIKEQFAYVGDCCVLKEVWDLGISSREDAKP